jgi:GNAT superfamily N-acetyltransferase
MRILFDMESGVPGVRLATKKDEGEIFGLLILLHAENGLFSMNRDKVLAGIQWATERKGGIIYCIDEGPRVVATMGMTIATDWYSDDEYLMERWNFVHPDYRRSDYALRLLNQGKWAHEWFKANGKLMPFFCGINSYKRTEAKIRLYARHMPLIGGYFMYGEAPRQQEEIHAEMRAIEERTRKSNAAHTREVRPAAETLIRVGQRREEEAQQHVR